ncbi:MAG: hypothetical protein HYV07_13495 [Deltaproteobacteria bacterium]|nr:hypothetical protein [Deltaproteobacteria bacterium]
MRERTGIAAVIATLALAVPAHAHFLSHPKTIRLGVSEDRIAIEVAFDLSPGDEARQARRLFDADADGELSPGETARLLAFLEQTARLFLAVRVDGRLVTLEKQESVAHRIDLPTDATDMLGLSLVLKAPIRIGSTPVRIELVDRNADASKDVPVLVDLGPGIRVVLAAPGELLRRVRQLQRISLDDKRGLVLVLRKEAARAD